MQPVDGLVRRTLSWDLEPGDVLRLVRDDAHPVALVGAWAPAVLRPPGAIVKWAASPATPSG